MSDPKDINPFPDTDHDAPKDMPPLTVMSLSVRTVVNHKENKREIVCATARIWSNSESASLSIAICLSFYVTIAIHILNVASFDHTSDLIAGCLGVFSPYRRFYSAGITPLLRSHIRTAIRSVPSEL